MDNSTLSDNVYSCTHDPSCIFFISLYPLALFSFFLILIFKRCKKADVDSASADEYGGSVHVVIQRDGLDAAAINTCPIYTYAQLKGDSSAACAICLGDYKDGQVARLLPACGHVFHRSCIDPWLWIHATCPVCRRNPTPPLLPVAQPAPVANQ